MGSLVVSYDSYEVNNCSPILGMLEKRLSKI